MVGNMAWLYTLEKDAVRRNLDRQTFLAQVIAHNNKETFFQIEGKEADFLLNPQNYT
jgi:hypothetical protein